MLFSRRPGLVARATPRSRGRSGSRSSSWGQCPHAEIAGRAPPPEGAGAARSRARGSARPLVVLHGPDRSAIRGRPDSDWPSRRGRNPLPSGPRRRDRLRGGPASPLASCEPRGRGSPTLVGSAPSFAHNRRASSISSTRPDGSRPGRWVDARFLRRRRAGSGVGPFHPLGRHDRGRARPVAPPQRVLFVSDVPGIYRSESAGTRSVIPEVTAATLEGLPARTDGPDVTGGIRGRRRRCGRSPSSALTQDLLADSRMGRSPSASRRAGLR